MFVKTLGMLELDTLTLALPEAALCRDAEADFGRCVHFLQRPVLNTETAESITLPATLGFFLRCSTL